MQSLHELPTYIALTYITLTIGVVLLHMLLAYDTLYYRLVSIPAYNLFSVSNSVFNCCLRQWWQDGGQINRRNTTHFRRSDSSTESREAASHLQICRVCQVSVDLISQTHSLTYCPSCPLAHQAATKDLHNCLSPASLWVQLQLWSKLIISVSIVRRHLFWGLPHFHLPSGVQWSEGLSPSW